MHSFNTLATEVKGWTVLRVCSAAGDEHKLSFDRVKVQMVGVHPQIDKIYVFGCDLQDYDQPYWLQGLRYNI